MSKIWKEKIIILLVVFMCSPLFAQLEKVADGFQFIEGPVWKDGQLLFSDIPANKIYKWSKEDGLAVFLDSSGKSNGLALDLDGNLLMAQHRKRRVARLEADGTETVLAARYDQKKLNSPNDIAVKSDGSIFFTDPPYGVSSENEELGYYGIYRISPAGTLYLLDKSLDRPNGITFSADEKLLYVTDAEARDIYVWDVADSVIENKRLFAHLEPEGYTDGLKVNALGRVFVTGPIGVRIYEADGTVIDTIAVPGQTSNCNWGDQDGRTLYITSGDALYKYRSNITDIRKIGKPDYLQQTFNLYDNYPNPFNPSTTIEFSVAEISPVKLSIFNILGQKVANLIDQQMNPGSYKVTWNAYNLPSGTYISTLKSNSNAMSKKMSLFK